MAKPKEYEQKYRSTKKTLDSLQGLRKRYKRKRKFFNKKSNKWYAKSDSVLSVNNQTKVAPWWTRKGWLKEAGNYSDVGERAMDKGMAYRDSLRATDKQTQKAKDRYRNAKWIRDIRGYSDEEKRKRISKRRKR